MSNVINVIHSFLLISLFGSSPRPSPWRRSVSPSRTPFGRPSTSSP
jgi:hypothetical protein